MSDVLVENGEGVDQDFHSPTGVKTESESRIGFLARFKRRSERAFVVVWVTFMLTLLLGFAGLAVDIGNWYLHIQTAQRAADAASLAGDIVLPADPTDAIARAKTVLSNNGVNVADVSLWTAQPVGGHPSQLQVTVKTTVPNIFLRFFPGMAKSQTFTRGAIADHEDGLALGSGRNILGAGEPNVGPEGPWSRDVADDANFWLAVNGSSTPKSEGDQFDPANGIGSCTTSKSPSHQNVYNCSGGNNADWTGQGYSFRVHIAADPAIAGSYHQVIMQVYDPGYYEMSKGDGNPCSAVDGVGTLPDGSCVSHSQPPGVLNTGDEGFSQAKVSTFTTTYTVHANAKNGPVVAGCSPLVAPGTQTPDADWSKPGYYIHQWVTLCTVNVDYTKSADYWIQVVPGPGWGTNQFAFRAGATNNGISTGVSQTYSENSISIWGDDSFPMDSQYKAPTVFPVTQVSSQWAGQTFGLDFFDVGDILCGGLHGTSECSLPAVMQLVYGNGTPLGWNCTLYGPAPNSPSTKPAPGCQVDFDYDDYDGQLSTLNITPPTSWVCDPDGPSLYGTGPNNNCWIFMEVNYNYANVDDDTTWTLHQPAKPLRIIK